MQFYWVIPLLSTCLSLILAGVVLRANRQVRANRVFALLAVSQALWNLTFFVFYFGFDKQLALELSKYLRVGTILMPTFAFHLAMELVCQQRRDWRGMLWLSYAAAIALSAANLAGLVVSDLRSYRWGFYSVPTPLYSIFTLLSVANSVAIAALLLMGFRAATSPRQRLVIKFWVLGAAIAVPLSLTNLLPVYHIEIYPLGSLGNVAFSGVIAYAMFRYRLMDFDVIVTRGMAYFAVSTLLIAPAFCLILWTEKLVFGAINVDFSLLVLVLLSAVGVLFPSLRHKAESRVEQSFFRDKVEHRNALASIAKAIVRILDRERLLAELGDTLREVTQVDKVAIWMTDQRGERFWPAKTSGDRPRCESLTRADHLIRLANSHGEILVRDELLATAAVGEQAAARTCIENGWEVCIPLTAAAKLIGLISLGRKPNLEPFYADELDLLQTLAAEASVALENARLYEELKKSQDIIRRADRLSALGTLAAGIAHEIRNPLVSIQTFFQLVPDRLNDKEFITTFLSMTAGEVKRIADLITELVSFARSPTRSLQAINLNDVVERVVTLLDPEARKHKLTLVSTLSPNVPLVHADADQVKQVLINLILNAIQATKAGGVISISSRCVQSGNVSFGQLEVRDTGVGIPPECLNDIFNPFFTTKDKGTGLGLAIAHQIVTEHGGFISVDSKQGQGTSFLVNFPAGGYSLRGGLLEENEPHPYEHVQLRRVAS